MAGRVTFSEENVKSSAFDFPKLKLQQIGEYGRIVCLEDPFAAYIHTLRKPRILNGRPQTTLVERKDGTKVEDFVKDFVSQPLCLGDEGIVADRGSDPAHCPACAEAQRGDMVDLPRRRFAMHVVKYQTRPGSAEIALPYQVQCVVWAYTENVFSKLVTIKNECEDLRQHDLTLGPLQPPVNFQKFDIGVSMKAEWLADEQRRDLTIATFRQNQAPDLEAIIGRKVQAKYMEDDIQNIRDAWQIANGFGNQPRPDASVGLDMASLGQGLDGLLAPGGQQAAPQAAPVAAPPAGDPWAQLAGGPVAEPQTPPTQAAQPDLAALQAQQQAQYAAALAAQQATQSAAAPAAAVPQVTNPSVDALAALAPQAAPAPPAQVSFEGLGEFAPATTQNPAAPVAQPQAVPPTAAPAAAAPATPGTVTSFDDLLKGI